MDKKTILAIVLSSLVLIISFMIQGNNAQRQMEQQQQQTPNVQIQETLPLVSGDVRAVDSQPELQPVQMIPAPQTQTFVEQDMDVPLKFEEIKTDLYTVVLTNAGGDMVSFKWRDPRNGTYVDLILPGDNEPRAFSLAFGDSNAQPISENFHVDRISEYSVEFYRYFTIPSAVYGTDGRFKLTKRYDFIPNEFMFRLTINLDGGSSVPGFDFAGNAYTLSFGPQIGPEFERLDGHYDYRRYNIFSGGKRRDVKANDIIDTRPSWAAISGKYFACIAIPLLENFTLGFSERAEPGLTSASRLNIIRPAVYAPRVSDTYRFYLGPRTQEILNIYNTGRNEFGIRDANLVEIAATRGFWGIFSPLERVLKWLLINIYGIVPNYGIAIILLTLLIKIAFFPLTRKGSEATIRMQALAPKMTEIREKYKNNPQKMQTEMAAFYKQEGYNPISGCLPMLLQMPIFISMFSLFNNHFDLRGAMFIPGWIPDLSLPEYIVQFENFTIPIVGWTALRALPFIYVGSQLLYGKVTQMPGQQSNTQMKMMLYIMPLVFFFVLYNVPSGLLVYWIFQNLLTLVQQVIINKYIIKRKAAQAQISAEQSSDKQSAEPKIAPGKKSETKIASGKKKKKKK